MERMVSSTVALEIQSGVLTFSISLTVKQDRNILVNELQSLGAETKRKHPDVKAVRRFGLVCRIEAKD